MLIKLKILKKYKFFKIILKIDYILKFKDIDENEEKNFENYLLNISKTLDIPLIATQEVFYLKKICTKHMMHLLVLVKKIYR